MGVPRLFFSTTALLIFAAFVGTAQRNKTPSPDADWPMYNRDLAGTRYSPLAQINTKNTADLKIAWSYRLSNRPAGGRGGRGATPAAEEADDQGGLRAGGGRPGGVGTGRGSGPPPMVNPEATPIVIGGVMYLPAGSRVLALDAESGKQIWEYKFPGFNTTARGVAYWPGEGVTPPRIMVTAGPRLVAINAITGEASQGFGQDGVVDIKVGWNGVPLIYKNVVMLGAAVGEMLTGDPGNTRAFDAR